LNRRETFAGQSLNTGHPAFPAEQNQPAVEREKISNKPPFERRRRSFERAADAGPNGPEC
jgi:hypothetical protein